MREMHNVRNTDT